MATCVISGTFLDPQGNALSGAVVRFNLENPVVDASGNLLAPKEVSTTTATDGTWSLTLLQSITGILTLDLNQSSTSPKTPYKFSLVIPASSTSTFVSCWVESGNFSSASSSSPLSFSNISGSLAASQLPGLTSAHLWIGNGSGAATDTGISGDISLTSLGAVTVNTVGGSSAANIHTAELLANAAVSTNTVSTLVKRDASGNFSAGTITASLAGNATSATSATSATTATTAANFSGSLVGDVSGSQSTTSVSKIAGTTVSGTTGSTNVVFSSSPTLVNPIVGTQSQGDASTKAASTGYVDLAVSNAVSGVNPAVAVKAATTQASDTSGLTYSNGVAGVGATFTGSVNTAFTVDGVTFTAVGQRVLIKNDTQSPSGAYNGVYSVTQIQTAILAPVLTRALDYNQPSDINNTGAIPVVSGTLNATTSWVQTAQITTVGTDALVFTEFTRNPADYLLKTNNLSDVSSTTTAFATLAPTPGTSGNVLTSTGSAWASSAPGSSAVLSAVGNINAYYAFS